MSDLSQLSTAELQSMLADAKAGGKAPRKVITANQPVSEIDAADTTTGGEFMARMGASFKMTPEGKINYLKHHYGDKNVLTDDKGNIYFRNKSNGRLTLFDEKDISLKDIADFAGDVPGVVLSTLGGIFGSSAPGAGSVAGAAAGAAAGNAIKQNISNVLPGSDQMTPLSRVGSMATEAALGGASQFGVNKVTSLFDLTRPSNVVARSAIKAEATPQAIAGRTLSAETGIPLSFAQETGSRAGAAVEGMARRNPVSADTFASFDRLQTEKAVARIKGIMNDVHTDEVGDVTLGQAAQRAFEKLYGGVVQARREQAAKDFAEVAKKGGDQALIPVGATKTQLLDLAKQFDLPGGGDATAKLARQIKATADELGMVVSPDQMNRLLQQYGKAAAGKGTIWADLDSAQQRMLAAKVHSALTKDLDTAAAGPVGSASDALRVARDNYAANSAKITEVSDSVIGRYFGTKAERTPERVADTILRMKPTEIRSTLGLLSRADPDIADQTARLYLERALDSARPAAGQSQGGQVTFSAAKFLNALPDQNVQQALLGGKPALGELKKVASVLERVADRPMEGSPTAPMLMAWDMARGVFTAGLSVGTMLKVPGMVLGPKTIAAAALTPQGRQALITVATTSKPTKEGLHALQYLGLLNAKDAMQDVDAAIAGAGR